MSPPPRTVPNLLQIVQERLNPGAEKAYGKIEEALARLCGRMNCPNPYMALASITVPIEVWWLNTYSSRADVEAVAQAYASNPALLAAMHELAAGKKGLTSDPVDLMTTYRPDLSDGSSWRIGELPFVVILEMQSAAEAAGAVFEAPDGRAFVLSAAATRDEAERVSTTLGRNARMFEVRPEWSLPYDDWVTRNPKLWAKG